MLYPEYPTLSSIEQDDKIWIRKDVYDALTRQKNFWRRCAGGLADFIKINLEEIPSTTETKEQAKYFLQEYEKLSTLYHE